MATGGPFRPPPFQWLMIGEMPDTWTVRKYRIGRGMEEPAIFLNNQNTAAEAVAPYLAIPVFWRIRYYSYITTVEQEGGSGAGGEDRGVMGKGEKG